MRTAHTPVGVLFFLMLFGGSVSGQEAAEARGLLGSAPVSVTAKLGASSLGGGGDLFELLRRDLGMGPSAFDTEVLELELSMTLGGRTDVFVGGTVRGSEEVATQAWQGVASTGQTTRLSVTPGIYAGARVFLLSRQGVGEASDPWTAHPYATVGVGRGTYGLRQWGEFVDVATGEPFTATFVDRDGYLRASLGIGVEFAVTSEVGFVLEARRDFASPTPAGDFHRFDDLSLSGKTLMIGLRHRSP